MAVVDTRSKEGDDGGQFGVSITDARGSLVSFATCYSIAM